MFSFQGTLEQVVAQAKEKCAEWVGTLMLVVREDSLARDHLNLAFYLQETAQIGRFMQKGLKRIWPG